MVKNHFYYHFPVLRIKNGEKARSLPTKKFFPPQVIKLNFNLFTFLSEFIFQSVEISRQKSNPSLKPSREVGPKMRFQGSTPTTSVYPNPIGLPQPHRSTPTPSVYPNPLNSTRHIGREFGRGITMERILGRNEQLTRQ